MISESIKDKNKFTFHRDLSGFHNEQMLDGRLQQPKSNGQLSNNIHDPYLPLSRQLQLYSLNNLLKADCTAIKEYEKSICWYINATSRKDAELILLESHRHSPSDGAFVIRECSDKSSAMSLSVLFNQKCFHYKLLNLVDCYFAMEDGKVFFGLDRLINYCRVHKQLACKLSESPADKCTPIPLPTRSKGIITILHKSCSYGNVSIVKQIVNQLDYLGSIDIRDPSGSTPLHIAASLGHCDIVEYLISNNAIIERNDSFGQTPLIKATAGNHETTCRVLLEAGADVNVVDKNKNTPLHIAAKYNSFACVLALLENHAPLFPRDRNNLTPIEIAMKSKETEVCEILKECILKAFKKSATAIPYLHPNINREGARELLKNNGNLEGSYLIRRSESNASYILSLISNSKLANYEIETNEVGCYFISDGPLFVSLDQLVDHYSRFKDRLSSKLTVPIINDGQTQVPNSPISRSIKQIKDKIPQYKRTSSRFEMFDSFKDHTRPRKGLCRPTSQSNLSIVSSLSGKLYTDDRELQRKSAIVGVAQNRTSLERTEPDAYLKISGIGTPSRTESFRQNAFFEESSSVQHVDYEDSIDVQSADTTAQEIPIIDVAQIDIIKQIGEGEFGIVYEAVYKKDKHTALIPVAVKKLKALSQQAIIDFKREANIMAKLRHPCIVKIYGMVVEYDHSIMSVQEYVHSGSLLNWLRNKKKIITLEHMKKWAVQIADAMNYMEAKCIVHRDLSARNVLVASMNQVKVCDFGLSRITTDDVYQQQGAGKIPIKWYAIESIEKGKFSQKSDVWSFGVTLWEIFSLGKEPYPGWTGTQVYCHVRNGGKLNKPDMCPASIYITICSCTEVNENVRPSFKQLLQQFSKDASFANHRRILKNL